MKKVLSFFLILCLTAGLLWGCGKNTSMVQTLSFAESASIETITALDGKQVTLTGYMATLSPLSGEYIYLMNLPYQSCPFCVPNTQQLANTMAVYAAKGSKFAFTDRPIRVTGCMELGDYTDEYGYTYNYRIVDATFETVDLSQISSDYALYESLAEDGIISDINAMFDYLLFICQWTEYQGGYTDENGNQLTYYLYPGDVENIMADDSGYGYGIQSSEDYFPGLIRRVSAVNADDLKDLIAILEESQALEQRARSDLANQQYTYDSETDKYILNNADALYSQFQEVYAQFSQWLTRYQL